MITEDRDLLQDALGPLYESDRRKVRIDFEAGRATSRSASGLFRFYAALLFALFAVRLQCIRAETAVNRINLKLKLIERSSVYEARCTKLGVQSSVYKARCTAASPMFSARSIRSCVKEVAVQINPYESCSGQGGDANQRRGRAVVVKICAAFSFLVCMPLVFLACWAWWLWWENRGVPAGVNSFPHAAFARQSTQWAVVVSASFFALWCTFWCVRWARARSTER